VIPKYGEDVGRAEKGQRTRPDRLRNRVDEGALTTAWPPERNLLIRVANSKEKAKRPGRRF
jgi:hypothetical protein